MKRGLLIVVLLFTMLMTEGCAVLSENKAEELYQAHETLYRVLRERDIAGVYGEIRSTYFIPDEGKTVIPLSEKKN